MNSPLAELNFFAEAQNWYSHWPDGLLVVDAEGRILAQSPTAKRMLGWRARDIRGKRLHEVLCVTSREFAHEEADCPLQVSAALPEAPRVSGVWQTASGMNINVDYRLILLPGDMAARCIVSFQDAQHWAHNQAELEKFAQYADNNPAPMAEFDAAGQLLFANPALQNAMLELGFDEFGQARIFPSQLNDLCEKCIALQQTIAPVEIQVHAHWYAWHFVPLPSLGETLGQQSVMGYAFDITQQKLAQAQAQQERIAASRDFYAKMMHELRTPLNAIIGFSDLLLRRGKERFNERELANLTAIKNAGFQLNELVSDTLDISKIEAGRMTVDLSDFLLEDVVGSIEPQMRSLAEAKGLRLQIAPIAEILLHSDRQKIRQVLVNLLSNGIKYTQQGTVTLRVTPVIWREQAALQLDVEDTGMGIPAHLMDGLFKNYQQIKEETHRGIQGTGLGLALVEELVFLLGGDIAVQSEYGLGSCFSVKLPRQLLAPAL
jgi:two-component system, autoinducer 2 sensor kinase/phosphatase LuxQ